MRQQKVPPIENNLPCSLGELYKGTTKKMKISREIADMSGKTMPVEEILTIEIKPGWKKETKITFPEKGNKQPNVISTDIVFIVDEKSHGVFKRDGNDLIVTQKISLREALTGYTVRLTTLDGRSLAIPIDNTIRPYYEEVVRGEGMPLPKDPSKKGNLRIKFSIKFPYEANCRAKSRVKKAASTMRFMLSELFRRVKLFEIVGVYEVMITLLELDLLSVLYSGLNKT